MTDPPQRAPMHRVTLAAALLLTLPTGAAPAAEDGHPVDRASALLARVAPAVEAVCGAEFPKPPQVVELSPETAATAFRSDLTEEIRKLYDGASEGQFRTLVTAMAESSVKSCVARYSGSLRAIVLVRASFDAQAAARGVPAAEREALLTAVLAHECVHALDDARFDLGRIRGATADREALRAAAMVVEGRAVRFGRLAAERLGVPAKYAEPLPGGEEAGGAHEAFLRLTYTGGGAFVAALLGRGGTELADRALREPPTLTWSVFHPKTWPDGGADPRPAEVLAAAFPDAKGETLSELELRARYAALDGYEAAERLFADYAGGAKALVTDTNAVVLAFATEDAATKFHERSKSDAPSARHGRYVAKAAGARAEEVLEKLRIALR